MTETAMDGYIDAAIEAVGGGDTEFYLDGRGGGAGVEHAVRLTYAQQRIRELEALLAEHGVEIPAEVTEVPPVSHRCF